MSAHLPATPSRLVPAWTALVVAIAAIAIGTDLVAMAVAGGGFGSMMGGLGGGSMMGWAPSRAEIAPATRPGPGEAGFVAGTPSAPRVVRIIAGPGYTFSPSSVTVRAGETITFVVRTMGPTAHEFMVGPADAVAGDVAGTPEVADIAMMQTRSVTYTFDGPGPYAFACHATGHYEAGMRGTVAIVP